MSDYGPSHSWDSYGGGGGGRRSSGRGSDYSRRSEDFSGSGMTAEEWSRPLPTNERLERYNERVKVHVSTYLSIFEHVAAHIAL